MALSSKVGSFVANTVTGNQAITGVGFQPKVVIFTAAHLTADGSLADAYHMFGVGISATDRRVVASSTDDAAATSATGGVHDDSKCIFIVSPAGATNLAADLVSLDSDGFTINITTETDVAYIINYTALGGDDLTNVKSGQFQENTSLGNQSVTGVGFRPDALIFFEARATTTAPPNGAGASVSYGNRYGFALTNTDRIAVNTRDRSGQATTNTNRYQRTDICFASLNTDLVDSFADFVSMDRDGFTFNMTDVAGAAYFMFYLALKGGRYRVGNFTQKVTTGTQSTTGIGFTPKLLMLMSVNAVASSSLQDNVRMSMGMASGSSAQYCIWQGSTDNAADSIADSNLDRTAIMKMMTEGTPSTEAVADLDSFDADGFTLDWTTADATARQIVYLAIGDNSTTQRYLIQGGI